jgi:hypothetical protein
VRFRMRSRGQMHLGRRWRQSHSEWVGLPEIS